MGILTSTGGTTGVGGSATATAPTSISWGSSGLPITQGQGGGGWTSANAGSAGGQITGQLYIQDSTGGASGATGGDGRDGTSRMGGQSGWVSAGGGGGGSGGGAANGVGGRGGHGGFGSGGGGGGAGTTTAGGAGGNGGPGLIIICAW